VLDLIHALSDADGCAQMINGVNFIQSVFNNPPVSEIAAEKLNIGIQIFRPPPFRAMHLRAQNVEDSHAMPMGYKLVCQMRTDEASSAGDQDSMHNALPTPSGCYPDAGQNQVANALNRKIWE
jgi:hypothetical protein